MPTSNTNNNASSTTQMSIEELLRSLTAGVQAGSTNEQPNAADAHLAAQLRLLDQLSSRTTADAMSLNQRINRSSQTPTPSQQGEGEGYDVASDDISANPESRDPSSHDMRDTNDAADGINSGEGATPAAPNFYQRHIRGRIQQFIHGLVGFFANLIEPIINFGYKDFFSNMFNKTCSFFQSIGSKVMNAVSSLASLFGDISSSAQACANDFREYAAGAEIITNFFRTHRAESPENPKSPETPEDPRASATHGPSQG